MSENRISDLLKVSLESIQQMVDVNLIIGDTVDVDGGVIIPIAKIKSGFITGGSDKQKEKEEKSSPFGGATGGTVTITPIAFLSCINGHVKVLHLEEESHLIGKAVDGSLELINRLISKMSSKTEPTVYPVERE